MARTPSCVAVSSLSSLTQMNSSSGSSVSPTSSLDSEDSAADKYSTPTRTSSSRTHSRRCSFPECQKTAKRGGLCISHGGGKKCSVDGCTTSVVSRGFCVAHGGGKRCQTPACTKSAQTGGFCWIHGGGKKCGYQGCKKRAQSGGACISHGGGKRCRMEGCNKVVQYDGLCVGHGGYRKCLSINCDKRALANSYCQAHGGNSMCRVADCRKRAVRGGICSEHKAQMPFHVKSKAALTRCRPSLDMPESPLKVEPTELTRARIDRYGGHPMPSSKASPELRGPSTYVRPTVSMDPNSPPTQEHVLSPLQYVRRGASSQSSLDDANTMVTPISRHFNAGEQYNPYRPKRQNLPVLPSFRMLQKSCSSSSPWSDGSDMDWSSSESTPNRSVKDSSSPVFSSPMQSNGDEFIVSLGRTCAHTCNAVSCSRHAKRNGLCLLHSISAPSTK